MGGLSCHMSRQKSITVRGSGPVSVCVCESVYMYVQQCSVHACYMHICACNI